MVKLNSSLSRLLKKLLESDNKLLGCTLIHLRSSAIAHLPDKEDLIRQVFSNLLIVLMMIHKSETFQRKISYMLESHLKNKWTTFLDKLSISENQNTLTLFLLPILVRESISKEKVSKPFWTDACKGLSEQLLSPIETDFLDLDSTLLNRSLSNPEEQSKSWMTTRTRALNKNSQKTFYQSCTSTAVAKWEKEAILKIVKTRKIPLKLSETQKTKIDRWIHTSRFVYNKTVNAKNNGYKGSKLDARNLFVTRKDNDSINEWEFETPKDIRAGAVFDCYKAFKTGFSQLKSGLVKYFRIGYKSRKIPNQCIVIPKNAVKYSNEKFDITYLKEPFTYSSRTKQFLENHTIDYDCRLLVQKGKYYLAVPISQDSKKCESYDRYCGIDPGCRTFMTVVNNFKITEYKHDQDTLKLLNNKIDLLRTLRIRKRHLNNIETRKTNLVNELHWKTIQDILSNNDIVMYGDIKSSKIVKKCSIKAINRNFNDLKFFIFKQRLLYKASVSSKKVFEIPEQYTSQTCSSCGNIYKPGSSKLYDCSKCHSIFDRDINAAKNILMKGILKHL